MLQLFGELQVQNDRRFTAGGIAAVLAGEEIAEAVGDEAGLVLAVVRRHVHGLHFADQMAVRAQDRIRAALKELLCQRLLRLRHLERCLAAPVEHHEDDVGLELLRRVH